MKILVLNGSSRERGNTERLTQAVLRDLPHTVINLREKRILPIDDKRHTEEGFQPVDDEFDEVITQMLSHDLLIFATPLYWYGMSGLMKNFVDRWSQALRDSRYTFKDDMMKKEAYVVIVGGDNPRIKALPLVQQFQYIFGFVSTPFRGYVIGEGGKPGDVENDERAMLEAEALHKQLNMKLHG
ncbi:flavodoxin family protein [Brevibacillus ginsengisoli]|uniref:flavodoxin family protein n=1 Tax=Brevibacillus ginsengisoli TaxID=363854 RepID=UPI003CF6755A